MHKRVFGLAWSEFEENARSEWEDADPSEYLRPALLAVEQRHIQRQCLPQCENIQMRPQKQSSDNKMLYITAWDTQGS